MLTLASSLSVHVLSFEESAFISLPTGRVLIPHTAYKRFMWTQCFLHWHEIIMIIIIPSTFVRTVAKPWSHCRCASNDHSSRWRQISKDIPKVNVDLWRTSRPDPLEFMKQSEKLQDRKKKKWEICIRQVFLWRTFSPFWKIEHIFCYTNTNLLGFYFYLKKNKQYYFMNKSINNKSNLVELRMTAALCCRFTSFACSRKLGYEIPVHFAPNHSR